MQTPAIASSAQPRLTRGVRLQTDSKTGNSVLLFPEGVLELNETAQEILNRCDGRTVNEIIQALALAVIISVVLNLFVVQVTEVRQRSMESTAYSTLWSSTREALAAALTRGASRFEAH